MAEIKPELALFDFEKPLQPLYHKAEKLMAEVPVNEKKLAAVGADIQKVTAKIYKGLNNWQLTQVARHVARPYSLDYIGKIFTDWQELHGDRNFRDDASTVCGVARFDGQSVVVVGQQKGRSTEENIRRNFGYPQPEAYRKALRFFKFAEKFNKPVVTLIDTPGAFPGLEGEERSQGEAIARNLREMAGLRVPIIAVIIGEGGSGGALGIGVANKVLMLEYSVYSVISPESCASILWRSSDEKIIAAKALKNDAKTALKFGIIDEIIPEGLGGAHRDPDGTAANIRKSLKRELAELCAKKPEELVDERIAKFAAMGVVTDL
ncbi:MAG: acetyl-CoA carboxylase carboxyltransferase subunit alpha [Spirochaetes bacterium]|nr:acetyl-CoA carboxylase carboxyltransferase subunit alpha [Spirochaetota bacterium]